MSIRLRPASDGCILSGQRNTLEQSKEENPAMAMKSLKFVALAILAASIVIPSASAQSSLFDRYDVNMTKWAQLDPAVPWGGETSMIALDGKGNVIVVVRVAPYFRMFTTDGKFVKAWGEAGMFGMAHSVHFDKEGNMWVADPTLHVVRKLNSEGKIVMTLGQQGTAGDNASQDRFNQPNFVAFGATGNVFVSDGYRNSRVVEFTKEGKFVRIFGGVAGNQPGQLQLPHGVAVDSKGRVIVSDSDNKRISVFDPDGKFVEIWEVPSRGGIAIAPDDTVYVSDVNAGAVSVVKNGKIWDVIKVDGRPHGLAIDPTNGDVYTTSSVKDSPNVTKAVMKSAAAIATGGRGANSQGVRGAAPGGAAPRGGAPRGPAPGGAGAAPRGGN
jgi:sugar lactone lactonase YvrE